MALTLHIDASRWRDHLKRITSTDGVAVVPVTKGNGYGFGHHVLAAEAAALGAPALAVGTYDEISAARPEFAGDLLVLSPWRPWLELPAHDDRVIHTISRVADLHTIIERGGRPRVVVEVMTSMHRHGIDPVHLPSVAPLLEQVRFEGIAIHLPLAGRRSDEALRLGRAVFDALPDAARLLWVSHLAPNAASTLGIELGAEVRLRIGSSLWLGDRAALTPSATVLDVHRLDRGERFGYRQRRSWRNGSLVVVSGGTGHGIGMEAPSPGGSAKQRAVSAAKGGLDAVGQSLSPFRIAGRQRWFAEPPHMQCSLIWLPGNITPPAPGEEVGVDVRFTTTLFDRTVWA